MDFAIDISPRDFSVIEKKGMNFVLLFRCGFFHFPPSVVDFVCLYIWMEIRFTYIEFARFLLPF